MHNLLKDFLEHKGYSKVEVVSSKFSGTLKAQVNISFRARLSFNGDAIELRHVTLDPWDVLIFLNEKRRESNDKT